MGVQSTYDTSMGAMALGTWARRAEYGDSMTNGKSVANTASILLKPSHILDVSTCVLCKTGIPS